MCILKTKTLTCKIKVNLKIIPLIIIHEIYFKNQLAIDTYKWEIKSNYEPGAYVVTLFTFSEF